MPRLTGEKFLLDQPLYDTVQLAAAAGPLTYSFFTNPLNGIIAGAVRKTYAHTNMTQAGTLERGTLFTITGVSLYVRETATGGARPTLADGIIIYGGWVELRLGQVNFGYWPAAQVPAGGAELVYFSNIAAAATEYHVNRGVSAVSNRLHLKHPIEIDEQESIEVLLTIPGTIAAVTDVSVTLWGDMLRPVR